MRNCDVGNHTGKTGIIVLFAGAIFALNSENAQGLVQARGANAPILLSETTEAEFAYPIIAADESDRIDWDQELLMMLEIFCIILRCDPPALTTGTTASIAVQAMMDQYHTQGLLPNLTAAEVLQGLTVAQRAKSHLRFGRGTPGTLGTGLAAQFDQTLTDIINDLHSRQSAQASTN